MIIMGIDPGLATTGYGVIKFEIRNPKFEILDCGCIKTAVQLSFAERLEIIHKTVTKLIKKYRPNTIAIEKIFFAKNAKTAMQVGEARGVITLAAIQNKASIIELTPLQVKQALTGYGQAPKEQVQKMVKMVLKLKTIPKSDDAADALAVAITCATTLKIYESIG